jgi:GH15 family glucan-1,4-alpha-glucosidase
MVCKPAFDYARADHEMEQYDEGVVFRGGEISLALVSEVPMQVRDGAAVSEFTLKEGDEVTFLLHRVEGNEICGASLSNGEVEKLFQETIVFWRQWISKCTYHGRWQEMVRRSALALKLLTFEPTGAIIAAPTMGLPEAIGGDLNWDYRYTWIRDASFTCYALIRLGFDTEARRFVQWLEERTSDLDLKQGGLRVMYSIDEHEPIDEQVLEHLAGYRGSKPVRLGNDAQRQLQLDIYGELMDAVYLANKYSEPISYDFWMTLQGLLGWLGDNWRQADEGIWEMRGGKQHFVHSRMMVWVAFERAVRIARQRGLPANIVEWGQTRDEVYQEVIEKGWNEKLQSFTQAYENEELDASNLLMPLVKFLGPNDPRMIKTLERTQQQLALDTLVYRYRSRDAQDDFTTHEGSFSTCSFWLVECLTRANRLDEARLMLEKMFSYANHLGLYAEEIGLSGEMLGNYPQALTHLALISATVNLDRRLGKE